MRLTHTSWFTARSPSGAGSAGLLAVLGLALLAPLQAHSKANYKACMHQRADDMLGQVKCGDAEIRRQEALLARAYQKARGAFVEEYGAGHAMLSHLQKNQAAWEKYRESLCALQIGSGGLSSAIMYNECQLNLLEQRIDALNHQRF